MPKNIYGCERRLYIATSEDNDDWACIKGRNMVLIRAVNNLSETLKKTKNFTLDTMSTSAVKVYLDINDRELAEEVLQIMENSIKTNTHPITKKPFPENGYGLTKPLMEEIVKMLKAR